MSSKTKALYFMTCLIISAIPTDQKSFTSWNYNICPMNLVCQTIYFWQTTFLWQRSRWQLVHKHFSWRGVIKSQTYINLLEHQDSVKMCAVCRESQSYSWRQQHQETAHRLLCLPSGDVCHVSSPSRVKTWTGKQKTCKASTDIKISLSREQRGENNFLLHRAQVDTSNVCWYQHNFGLSSCLDSHYPPPAVHISTTRWWNFHFE